MYTVLSLPLDNAFAINNRGEVAGNVTAPLPPGDRQENPEQTTRVQAAVYAGGRIRRLSGLRPSLSAAVGGINDRGEVVGTLSKTTSGAVTVVESIAVLWDRNGALRVLSKPGERSAGTGINQHGQSVGVYIGDWAQTDQAFLRSGGKAMILGRFNAVGINDRGQVVGSRDRGAVENRRSVGGGTMAVLWHNGKRRDLGMGTGSSSEARAINNRGQIVGSILWTDEYAVLWDNGRMRELPSLPAGGSSSARSINDRGDVVGSVTDANGVSHAVLWQNGKILRLDQVVKLPAGAIFEEAVSINNRRQIVVTGYRSDNTSHFRGSSCVYLLTPRGIS
ncbi:MAG: hypothetical protein V4671_18625 [Armatimonadota bacterium]